MIDDFDLFSKIEYYFFRDGKSNSEPTNWTRLPGQVNQ